MKKESLEIFKVFSDNCKHQLSFFSSIVNLGTEISQQATLLEEKVQLYTQLEESMQKWTSLVIENKQLLDKFQKHTDSSPNQLEMYEQIQLALATQEYVRKSINDEKTENWMGSSNLFVLWHALLKYNMKPLLQDKKKSLIF